MINSVFLLLQVKEMLQMQADFDADKAKLNAKINELTVTLDRSKSQLVDRDQTIRDLSTPSRPMVRIRYKSLV